MVSENEITIEHFQHALHIAPAILVLPENSVSSPDIDYFFNAQMAGYSLQIWMNPFEAPRRKDG
jgi:hypothetical protein